MLIRYYTILMVVCRGLANRNSRIIYYGRIILHGVWSRALLLSLDQAALVRVISYVWNLLLSIGQLLVATQVMTILACWSILAQSRSLLLPIVNWKPSSLCWWVDAIYSSLRKRLLKMSICTCSIGNASSTTLNSTIFEVFGSTAYRTSSYDVYPIFTKRRRHSSLTLCRWLLICTRR